MSIPAEVQAGSTRRRGLVRGVLAVSLAVVVAFPGVVPNAGLRGGSLVETFRPWSGLGVAVLVVLALVRRSRVALVAVVVPAVAWLVVFGSGLMPEKRGGTADLVVVQHNVSDVNPDAAGTAEVLLTAGPDLVALEELTPGALPAYGEALGPSLPHFETVGTVGLWSAYPLSDVRAVDLKPASVPDGWSRGLRATAATPGGPVAVYVAHLPSVRLGVEGFGTDRRDESARRLGRVLAGEPLSRVLVIGDLNGTTDDRGLDPVLAHVGPGGGRSFAFTWPAGFPLARIDQVLGRGVAVVGVRTLPRTGSDHLALVADVRVR